MPRHDADLALSGLDDTRTIGTNDTSLGLCFHCSLDPEHILGRDTLSDADSKINF